MRGRVAKNDPLAEALGSIDELNSWMGACRVEYGGRGSKVPGIDQQLHRVQRNLMTIASALAGGEVRIEKEEIAELEVMIDKWSEELPRLQNFIYPLGQLHVVRTVARRTERAAVGILEKENGGVSEDNSRVIKEYLNRLSDWLFMLARVINRKYNLEEEIWKG